MTMLCHLFGQAFCNGRDIWLVFIITMFYKIHVFNANSVETDQTPLFVASDLDLRIVPVSL